MYLKICSFCKLIRDDASLPLHLEGVEAKACPACYKRAVGKGEKVEEYGVAVRNFRCSTCRGQAARWAGGINTITLPEHINSETCLRVHRALYLCGVTKIVTPDTDLQLAISEQAVALISCCNSLPWSVYRDPSGKITREMFSVSLHYFKIHCNEFF